MNEIINVKKQDGLSDFQTTDVITVFIVAMIAQLLISIIGNQNWLKECNGFFKRYLMIFLDFKENMN